MPIVKILVVTDDQSGGFTRSVSKPFHIGEFVTVLQDTVWDGFTVQITRAHRYSSANAPGAGADLYGFRFSDASLAGFDMAFFLSIATPAEDTSFAGTTDASRKEEAAAIARFMEAGKGFFATGDHEDLGAGVNMHVPRVRSMRRWFWSGTSPYGLPGAPSGTGSDRHDTLQQGNDTGSDAGITYPFQFNDQSDAIPQPLSVKRYTVHSSRYFRTTVPHPLLCSPLGTIDVFPDHMHEGHCEVPADLTQDENLPGRAGKKEYPPLSGSPFAPEVIAEGTVLAHPTLNQEFSGSVRISALTPGPYRFGVLGAWDGHRVGLGRVVVDSTWHHHININLIGTSSSFPGLDPLKTKGFYAGPGDTAVPAYEKIKHHFRNLVYWLIPASRWRAIWPFAVELIRHNPAFEEMKNVYMAERIRLLDLIRLSHLADHYFSTTRGHCYAFQLLPIILYPIWRPDWHIWEGWEAIVDPWSPVAQATRPPRQPADSRQLFGYADDVPRHLLLGSLVAASLQLHAELGGVEKLEENFAPDDYTKRLSERLRPILRDQSEQVVAAAKAAASDLANLAKGMQSLGGEKVDVGELVLRVGENIRPG